MSCDWIDGGMVDGGNIGNPWTGVLKRACFAVPDGATGWLSIRGQAFVVMGSGEHFDVSSMTLYEWQVLAVSEAQEVTVAASSKSRVVVHSESVHGWNQVISLCSGMGGAMMGLEAAGFETKVACDRSGLSCAALNANFEVEIIQGDLGDLAVTSSIHLSTKGVRMWLEAGYPCQPFSRLGDQRAFDDPRARTFLDILRCGWLWQVRGYILECVETVHESEEVGLFLDEFCRFTGMQRVERILHLQDSWPCRRSRWWCILFPAEWPAIEFDPMPGTEWKKIEDIIPSWPIWPEAEEACLRWTSEEIEKYRDPSYRVLPKRLQMTGQAPTALHSCANHFGPCPCGCRAGPLNDDRLRRGGLLGIEVVSSGEDRASRHPHPQELGLLNGVSPGYSYGPNLKGALCLVGQIASPFHSLWTGLHVRKAIANNIGPQAFEPIPDGEEKIALYLYGEHLLEERQELWPLSFPVDQQSQCCVWTGDHVPFETKFKVGTSAQELIAAQANLNGVIGNGSIDVAGREVTEQAMLIPNALYNVRLPASSLRDSAIAMKVTVTFDFRGEQSQFQIPAGAFLFECFSGSSPEVLLHYRALLAPDSCWVPWDMRQWQDALFFLEVIIRGAGNKTEIVLSKIVKDQELEAWQQQLHAGGNAPSLDEGLDDLVMYHAGRALFALSAHSDCFFVGPRKAFQWSQLPPDQQAAAVRETLAEYDGDRILVLFGSDGHWALLDYQLIGDGGECAYVDGIPDRLASEARFFAGLIHGNFGHGPLNFTSASCYCQDGGVTCGAVALLHLGWRLSMWSSFTKTDTDMWYRHLRWYSAGPPIHGGGRSYQSGESDPLVISLGDLLEQKGVPKDKLEGRIQAAIKAFGRGRLEDAMRAKIPWQALKSLGSARPKPWMWVQYDELQRHIEQRGSEQWGAKLDARRPQRARAPPRGKPNVKCEELLQPEALELLPKHFHDGHLPVCQIKLEDVKAGARGVAFCKIEDAGPFIVGGESISTEPLMLLTLGQIGDTSSIALTHSQMEVPAKYVGTGEHVIVRCTALQLGDDVVMEVEQVAHEVSAFPTSVVRVHMFRDEVEIPWADFCKRPVRALVEAFSLLQLCKQKDCSLECGMFHPAVEELGVDSPIMDLWGFRWSKLDGSRVGAPDAEVWQLYIRCPESLVYPLQSLSGIKGAWFEPRKAQGSGPDAAFSVIWIPGVDLRSIQHLAKTHDLIVGIARMGHRFGVRTYEKHAEEVHQQVCPSKPFMKGNITLIFRLEPLPVGTQRQSLAQCLSEWGWNAKPLQASKGTSGRAWEVGATEEPPAYVFKLQSGYVTVTKMKDFEAVPSQRQIIAPIKTQQHIRRGDPSSSSSSQPKGDVDPWLANDPWGGFFKNKSVAAASPGKCPTEAVKPGPKSKIVAVEERLFQGVATQVQEQLKGITSDLDNEAQAANQERDQSISQIEVDIEEIRQQGRRFEQMFVECAQTQEAQIVRIAGLETAVQTQGQATQQMQNRIEECGGVLQRQEVVVQSIATDMQNMQRSLTGTLDDYFARQTAQIESLLATPTGLADKRQRREERSDWLGHGGPAVGQGRTPPSVGFSRKPWPMNRWWMVFFFWFSSFRFGEAQHPGPCGLDPGLPTFSMSWNFDDEEGDLFGSINPSGISNKLETFRGMPRGWWGIAETQASKRQISQFRSVVKNGVSGKFHVVSGAPAPLRPGSNHAGAWTGVLHQSSWPLRQVQLKWPDFVWESGRVCISMGFVNNVGVVHGTVYIPPRGPTHPAARELGAMLLEPLTEELVLGRKGCRCISGDCRVARGAGDHGPTFWHIPSSHLSADYSAWSSMVEPWNAAVSTWCGFCWLVSRASSCGCKATISFLCWLGSPLAISFTFTLGHSW